MGDLDVSGACGPSSSDAAAAAVRHHEMGRREQPQRDDHYRGPGDADFAAHSGGGAHAGGARGLEPTHALSVSIFGKKHKFATQNYVGQHVED